MLNLANVGKDIISTFGIAKLIHNLPKLVSLGGYQNTGEAIHILNLEMNRTHPTKLKYLYDTGTQFQCLNSIQVLCPGEFLSDETN